MMVNNIVLLKEKQPFLDPLFNHVETVAEHMKKQAFTKIYSNTKLQIV